MTRIISRPSRPPLQPRMRAMVGLRFAAFYPEGTVIEDRHGVRWRSWRADSYATMDCAPAWLEITEPEPDIALDDLRCAACGRRVGFFLNEITGRYLAHRFPLALHRAVLARPGSTVRRVEL